MLEDARESNKENDLEQMKPKCKDILLFDRHIRTLAYGRLAESMEVLIPCTTSFVILAQMITFLLLQ